MRVEQTKDSELINRILNDDSIHTLISDDGSLEFETDMTSSIEIDGVYFLKVVLDEEVIGVIFIHKVNHITCEMHMNILGQFCGKGNAVTAGKLGLQWVFERTTFTKVVAHIPVNEESEKVLKVALKSGMSIDGTIKDSYMKYGKVYDQYILGINKGVK